MISFVENLIMEGLNQNSDFLFYKSENGEISIQVIIGDETVWLTQKSMAEIFKIDKSGISRHLKNIFDSGELDKDSVVAIFATTANDGKIYETEFYKLDAIISVGYRVNSYEATQFRKWATKVLRQYLIKGFALDNERLKQGNNLFDKDYFEELLTQIREIRASERRFYQKITDIYATSIDYNNKADISKEFFATVQNKLHWAIHGNTAAELIKLRADKNKPKMGLTTWKNKDGKILKTDVAIAKNYLQKEEIEELNRVVSMYLDFAENMAKKGKLMKMVDWVKKLDNFLEVNEYDILKNAGAISKKIAKQFAEAEYSIFRVQQDKGFKSDFDKLVEKTKKKKG